MSVMNNDFDGSDFPPLSPVGEQHAPNDPAFIKTCLSNLDILSSVGSIKAGTPLLSENPTWGAVFRVDFTIDGKSVPRYVNRLICWKQKDGKIAMNLAIGQDADPLN